MTDVNRPYHNLAPSFRPSKGLLSARGCFASCRFELPVHRVKGLSRGRSSANDRSSAASKAKRRLRFRESNDETYLLPATCGYRDRDLCPMCKRDSVSKQLRFHSPEIGRAHV